MLFYFVGYFEHSSIECSVLLFPRYFVRSTGILFEIKILYRSIYHVTDQRVLVEVGYSHPLET